MCRAQQISPRGQTNVHSSYVPYLYRQYLGDSHEMDEWNTWPSNTWSRGSNSQGWSRPSSTFFNRNPYMYLSGDDDRWWNPFSSRPAYTTGDATTYYNVYNDQNGRLHRMPHAHGLYRNYQRFNSPWLSDDFSDNFSDNRIPYYPNQFNGWQEGVRRNRARSWENYAPGYLYNRFGLQNNDLFPSAPYSHLFQDHLFPTSSGSFVKKNMNTNTVEGKSAGNLGRNAGTQTLNSVHAQNAQNTRNQRWGAGMKSFNPAASLHSRNNMRSPYNLYNNAYWFGRNREFRENMLESYENMLENMRERTALHPYYRSPALLDTYRKFMNQNAATRGGINTLQKNNRGQNSGNITPSNAESRNTNLWSMSPSHRVPRNNFHALQEWRNEQVENRLERMNEVGERAVETANDFLETPQGRIYLQKAWLQNNKAPSQNQPVGKTSGHRNNAWSSSNLDGKFANVNSIPQGKQPGSLTSLGLKQISRTIDQKTENHESAAEKIQDYFKTLKENLAWTNTGKVLNMNSKVGNL